MRKRTVAVPLSVLAAAAGLAGGALAASQSDPHPHKASGCGSERAVLGDAARRLHVTPARLTDALRAAVVDQIDAAVAAGHLTRAQAKTIKRQIEQSPGLAFGPGLLAPEIKAAHVIAPPARQTILAPGPFGRLTSAAKYLGLTDRQLMQRLRRGESLAQIAKAQGKSEAGLKRAITTAVRSQFKNISKAKQIPRALEKQIPLSSRHIQGIVGPGGPGVSLPPPGRVHIQVCGWASSVLCRGRTRGAIASAYLGRAPEALTKR